MRRGFFKTGVVSNTVNRLRWMRRDFIGIYRHQKIDFLSDIIVETTTACNRKCAYCPNSISTRGEVTNTRLMDATRFKKIVDGLADMKFSGRFSPHFYGEPLLDDRMEDLILYARERLPRAKILIVTNGDFLDLDLATRLTDAGVNEFNVTLHSERAGAVGAFIDKIPKPGVVLTRSFRSSRGLRSLIRVRRMVIEQPLYNRGGLLKVLNRDPLPKCAKIDNPMVVDYLGNIILCCNDYSSSVVLGNIATQSIGEIWASARYVHFRAQMRQGKMNLGICRQCQGGTPEAGD